MRRVLFGVTAFLVSLPARAATLEVGAGKPYATPCEAIAVAADGDVIAIDAAVYPDDACTVAANQLTLRGVGGLAHLAWGGGPIGNGKAIWVIAGDDTTVENIEFSGATVADENGAGIRQEGTNLTVRGCYFHDNENGILAGSDAASEILIERSEFVGNGFGDGQTHNLYINEVGKLTFRYNWSHAAVIGHLLKSRALENHILYNRLTGEGGTASYEIDLPQGGLSFVIGNLIEQGPDTDNASMLSYALENQNNPSQQLYVVHNTFVNDRPSGGTFINIAGAVGTAAVARNNVFFGPGTIINQATAVVEGSCTDDPLFVDQAAFDYHIGDDSPCKDMGIAPGTGDGVDLTPDHHYVHPAGEEGRMSVGTIDIGAYELGGGVAGSGGAGGGSGGNAGGSGPGSGGDGATGGASGTPTGSGAASGTPEGDDDGGCSCRHARAPVGGSWLALLALAALARRRRFRG
jgi:MYXO-CTERM domain-containing protein